VRKSIAASSKIFKNFEFNNYECSFSKFDTGPVSRLSTTGSGSKVTACKDILSLAVLAQIAVRVRLNVEHIVR
jgi:hypothetical protein